MQEVPAEEATLQAAGDALASGAWTDAYALLLDADRARRLTDPKSVLMLAQAAYVSGNIEAATQAFERVHTAAIAAGDTEMAAAAAGQVAFMLFDAVMYAPSRAWLRRAERLVEGRPKSPARALITNGRAWHALIDGDYDSCIALAQESASQAEQSADRDMVAVSRLAEGRALIARGDAGDIDEGLLILDESAVAAVSGELSPIATGTVYCNANCAFQSVFDYERAEQWTRAMEHWSAASGITSFQGRCRVHRAQLKRLHGDWDGAASEATKASEELGSVVPAERGWAISELGLIRLRLGDLAGAEALFLEARETGWEPQPGLSLLRLAQGDVPAARSAIRDALERAAEIASREVPPHGALRRAPLLAAQVEIAIAAGDLATAGAAAAELEAVAATYKTPALRASASGASALVELAEGDHAAAMRSFQSAIATWQALDAPYEVARIRLGMAEAAKAAGNGDRATVEYKAALAGFERLEAVLDARRVSDAAPELAPKTAATATPRRSTRTFMFTDIVQSTNLLAVIGDEAWQHLLRWHDETLTNVILQHNGTVANRTGDGFFATFENEADAIDAAVATQGALAEHRRTAGFAPRVRIGLHTSEADSDGTNWTGIGVHAAARIGALAEGDEIVASYATALGAAATYALSEPRSVTLRGMDEPVDVVSVDWRTELAKPS